MKEQKNTPGGQTGGFEEGGAGCADLCLTHTKNIPGAQAKKLNRRRAIRARCYDCSGFNRAEIRECPITDCKLYPYRMATGRQDPKARDRAIRVYCLWCMNGQRKEVSLCPSSDCPLYPYRQTPAAMQRKRHIGETLRDKIPAKGV